MSSTVTNAATHVWRPSSARRVVLDGFAPVPRGAGQSAPAPLQWPAKDPSDVLDYEFDVSAAVLGNEGDMITGVTASVTPNATGDLVINSVSLDGSVVVFWFAGGQAGTTYVVQATLTTSAGRTIGRVVLLPVLSLANATVTTGALTTNLGAVVTDQGGNPILLGS
jgi:hypothetical protein